MKKAVISAVIATLLWQSVGLAQVPDAQLKAKVDSIAEQTLRSTGVPSASVAIVQHGRLVYANAYGAARLEPRTAATPELTYGIGSISKQFTAAAVLLLAEEGRLSLDDKLVRWFPSLTGASEAGPLPESLRQALRTHRWDRTPAPWSA